MTRQNVEQSVNDEILTKYSQVMLDKINSYENLKRDFFKFAILRCENKDEYKKNIHKIKDFLNEIKKIINYVNNKKEILNCINLYLGVSEDEKKEFSEVFTHLYEHHGSIDEQLKNVDSIFWKNPYNTVIDPSTGIGNYVYVIINNFMEGLKDYKDDKLDLTDENIRYKHIMENQIYVCEYQTKNLFFYLNLFDKTDDLKLNYFKGDFLSKEFDEHMKNVWKISNFNLCTTNPPYTKIDGGGKGDSGVPLYNTFIEKGIKISDKVLMITPSRWFNGGRGLDKFRDMMLSRVDIKYIKHFDNEKDVFDVELPGGVSYCYIDKSYNGKTIFEIKLNSDENIEKNEIILNNKDILITNKLHNSIVDKILSKELNTFDQNVLSQKPFDMRSNYNNWCENGIPTITTNGIKFANINDVNDKFNILDKYKLLISKADGAAYKAKRVISKYIIAEPGQASIETYLVCATSDNREEIENIGKYIMTKFSRFLLLLRLSGQNNSKDKFSWVPVMDFSKTWTDNELYNYFNLTEEEIDLIEKTIK